MEEIMPDNYFKKLEPKWVVTPGEATTWVKVRNANLPTMTGSQNWQNYMGFLEQKLEAFGIVNTTRNRWPFERWKTSNDPRNWSLVSDNEAVRVPFYGAYSGATASEGITAELVYYDHLNPPQSIEDKIVVIPTLPHPEPPYTESPAGFFSLTDSPFSDDYVENHTFSDYEYRSESETFPQLFEYVDPKVTFTFDIWWQMQQGLHEIAIKGSAAGTLIVYDMAFERTDGLYTFPTPGLYNSPTLILDREAGEKVIKDAKESKSATLRLEATLEPAEAFQLIGYLPGKDFDTQKDEQVILVSHTDGPSITQDNGALGLLAIIKYFSNISQQDRPRTLTLFLDCRHYMPGMEQEHMKPDWLQRHPEAKEPIVGLIHIEHLGEMEYREIGGKVEPTGFAEHSYLWTRNNQKLVDHAIQAVKEHHLPRVNVVVPERPGSNGDFQRFWWAGTSVRAIRDLGHDAYHCLDIPGFGFASNLGYYYTVHSNIDRWNRELFLSQVKTMTQLTGVMMTAKLEDIRPL
jgi:hypothetical protein